jgi:ABC-type sugar transport system ATPase subunit
VASQSLLPSFTRQRQSCSPDEAQLTPGLRVERTTYPGVASLIRATQLDELFEICDRIAVLSEGKLSPAMPKTQTNAKSIGLLMAGKAEKEVA